MRLQKSTRFNKRDIEVRGQHHTEKLRRQQKSGGSISRERPLLKRRDTVVSAIDRLRSKHLSTMQDDRNPQRYVHNAIVQRINVVERAIAQISINKSWPYPDIARVVTFLSVVLRWASDIKTWKPALRTLGFYALSAYPEFSVRQHSSSSVWRD